MHFMSATNSQTYDLPLFEKKLEFMFLFLEINFLQHEVI